MNNRELVAEDRVTLDLSSLSELSSFSVTGEWPAVRLSFTGTKLVLASLIEGLASIVGSSHSTGILNFVHGTLFPGPMS